MNNDYETFFDEFIAACHRTALLGLVRCGSGNLSLRLNKERMLITNGKCVILIETYYLIV